MDSIHNQPLTSSKFVQNAAKNSLEKFDTRPASMYQISNSEQSAMEVFSKATEENGTASEKQLLNYVKKASSEAINTTSKDIYAKPIRHITRKGVYIAVLQNMSSGMTGPLSKAIAKIALDSHKIASGNGHIEMNREFARTIQETGSPIEKEAMEVLNNAYENHFNIDQLGEKMNAIQLSFMKDVAEGINKPLREYLLEKAESSSDAKMVLGKAITEKLESMASGNEKIVLNTTAKALKGNKFGVPNNYTQRLIEHIAIDNVKTVQNTPLTQNIAQIGSQVVKNAADKWFRGTWTGSETIGGNDIAMKGNREAKIEGLKAGTAYIETIAANSEDKKEKILSQAIVDTLNIAQNQYEKSADFAHISWDILDYSLDVIKNGTKGPVESHLAACGMALMTKAADAKPKYAVEIAQPILQAIANNSADPKNAEIAKEALNIETSVGKAIKSTFLIGESNKEYKVSQYTEAFKKILENVDVENLSTPNGTDQTDYSLRAKLINKTVSR